MADQHVRAAHTVAAGLVGLVCTGRQEASREGFISSSVHTYKPTTVFRSMYLLIRLKGAKEASHSVKHRQAKSTDLNLNVSFELMLATSVPAD